MSDPVQTLGYGEYSLSPIRERIRQLSTLMPANRLGRLATSLLRKLTVVGRTGGVAGPFDIEVVPGIRARLFPSSNLCEKRVFCGVQNWDSAERAALSQAVQNSEHHPFVFIDVGANVGLYSLFLWAAAEKLGRQSNVIAVEPDPLNRSRLHFNISANDADVTIEPVAIGNQVGAGLLSGGAKNRGEVRLTEDDSADAISVTVDTLPNLISRHGLTHVDAMKVDIEGYDLPALKCLFAETNQSLWPNLLIVETGQSGPTPLVAEIVGQGYELVSRTRLNAILQRP